MNHILKKACLILGICILLSSIVLAEGNFETVQAYLKNTNIKTPNASKVVPALYYGKDIYIPAQILSTDLNYTVTFNQENNTLALQNNVAFEDFAPSNPWVGENFVYGQILKIDRDNKIMTIEQHFDDNSISIEPNIKVSEKVIIVYQRNNKKMNLDFEDLKIGDIIGTVLTKECIARGIILTD